MTLLEEYQAALEWEAKATQEIVRILDGVNILTVGRILSYVERFLTDMMRIR